MITIGYYQLLSVIIGCYWQNSKGRSGQYTEVRFASFHSGGFITAIVCSKSTGKESGSKGKFFNFAKVCYC